MSVGEILAERGWLPDAAVRLGIRRRLHRRIDSIERETAAEREALLAELIEVMDGSPIAPAVPEANEQHYELPAEFFRLVLGARMKYSCAFWPAGTPDLDAAEEAMLARTCEHAQLEDGMRVLDLGSGWGSLAFWIAERYPGCRVETVSASEGQQAFIRARAEALELDSITTLVADMNDFAPSARYDRIFSVEMFEHMRNYRRLLGRLRSWLEPEGRVLVHIFCHRRWPYAFEAEPDWMEQHFFTAGLMPCDDLLYRFDDDLEIDHHWSFSGEHYQRTCEAWLRRMERHREAILEVLAQAYGAGTARLWYRRWRIFYLACSELFGLHRGQEWWVSHYRLRPCAREPRAGNDRS